ncbi:MAG TPA: hypothetical protein IAB58_01555 [Candidatus Pelethosoma merdigallinarum]|nr:hypothetical protein [Candidatus Pelethosoma merdigallinarum]
MLFNNRCCCNQRQMMMPRQNMMNGCGCGPIIEPTTTRCIQQEFCHEVKHVCPIHTHKINKHIYKHTYTPQYTCSEEDQMVNIDCGSCSQFQ